MTQLIILRHGNTFDAGDIVTRVGGRTDLVLSSSGMRQAQAVAEHFANEGWRFSQIISGPLRRTLQTAERIAERICPKPLIEIEAGLREIDYGPDENRPEAEVIARIGEAALAAWEEDGTPPPDWRVDVPGSIAFWRSLFLTVAGSQGPVLVVTSNGIARFALDAARQSAPGLPRKLKTAAWGRATINENGDAQITHWGEQVRPQEGTGKA
jgi:broad specificity phosphatase PhoE